MIRLDGLTFLYLEALRTVDAGEIDGLAFLQAAKAVGLDSREMHENIIASLAAVQNEEKRKDGQGDDLLNRPELYYRELACADAISRNLETVLEECGSASR